MKLARRIAITLTAIVAVLLALPLMVYVPPVQRWLVSEATAMASEATGLDISIETVSLRFPLTLSLEDVTVIRPSDRDTVGAESNTRPSSDGDTIAVVTRIDADLALLPLFKLRAELSGLTIKDARMNTLDLISDTQVQGIIGQLSIGPTTAAIVKGSVDVTSLTLADTDICVLLSDTAAVDTTESEPLPWLFTVHETTLSNVSCEVHMPGDSMIIDAALTKVVAANIDIDLLEERYAVPSLRIEQSSLAYDLPFEPQKTEGIDYSHLAFNDLSLAIDSFVYCAPASVPVSRASSAATSPTPPFLSLAIRHASMQERCGLQLSDLTATVALDSLGIRIPSISLTTPSSSLFAQASLDYASLDAQQILNSKSQIVNSKSVNSKFLLDASLSRHDIAHFYPLKGLSDWPLTIKAKGAGNVAAVNIETLTIDLPTVLHAEAQGNVGLDLPDTTAIAADMDFSLIAHNVNPLLNSFTSSTPSYRIPSGTRLSGTLKAASGQYNANVTARDGKATVKAKGMFDTKADAYTADLDIMGLAVSRFLPTVDATIHQASVNARGHGFDFFDKKTFLEATTDIGSITYGRWQADSIHLDALLDASHLQANIASHNNLADGTIAIGTDFTNQNPQTSNLKSQTSNLKSQISIDLSRLDLQAFGVSDKRLEVGLTGDVTIDTNLKDSHKLSGLLKDISLTAAPPDSSPEDTITRTFHPENLGVLLAARPDTTYARVQNGNFIVKIDASGPYDQLFSKLSALTDTITHQLDNRIIDQALLKDMLPNMRLYVTSGRENAPANILRASQGIDFKELLANITTSPDKGVNGQMFIHNLGLGSTLIDTVNVTLKDSDHGLTYQTRIANGKKNPLVFIALMDGHIYEHGARLGLRIFDKNGQQGLRLGTQASMENDGIRFTLLPKNPTLAYHEFTLNDDNYLFLRKDLRLSAKVEMENDEGTTIDVYSTEETDTTRLQDLTVSLAKLDLKQLTDIIPFMPSIKGLLNGDFHIIMDQEKQISVATEANVNDMVYEGNAMGNIGTEFVYLQNTDETHTVDGILLREGQQVASIEGQYINKKVSNGNEHLDVILSLVNTPLNMANGFITDQIVGLEGYANGQFAMKGPLNKLIIDGSVKLDSATVFSTPYGIRMGIDDQPITITQSKLTLDNFKLYASPELQEKNVLTTTFNLVNKAIGAVPQPTDTVAYLTITGTADFSASGPAPLDFRVRANELQLINSKQQVGSLLYGKGFVSIMAMVRGTTEKMTVRGRFNVLGKTDITYLLLDSPLSTDNQMDELVRFTDFNDSTQIAIVQRPVPNGMDVNLTVNIDQGAHIRCGLNADQSNYVDIFGGGSLRLRMSESEDMTLTGRYTISNGTMKYSMPVIPLKTFTIQDGSYVEFTGSMDNPTLNITATERTRATVGQEGSASRSVAFDCGVIVTKTLNDMGLQFIISAPEDVSVQSELQSMTVEQRGKLAVTMLTTGMYLADGNTAGFSMNSALSSFLQSEINNIAGNALSTLDISMGVDNTTDASGNMHTDYSFQFAKRFWNNRLKVEIGGKVSSGQEVQGQKQSFFDNVSMEYRLSPTSNQYLKLFYKQNVYDWLDGYTGEYGVGYIYKRKMDHWWDMFQLWKIDNKNK